MVQSKKKSTLQDKLEKEISELLDKQDDLLNTNESLSMSISNFCRENQRLRSEVELLKELIINIAKGK